MSEAHSPDETLPSEMTLGEALALAVQRHRIGDIDNAEIVYRRILEVVPEQPDALNFLGMIVMHRGRIDEAVYLIGRSLEIDPDHGDRYNNLGNVLLAAERIDEAVAAYERAIAKSPDSPAAYNNLGVIYRAQGRFDEAERAYARAVELDPTSVEAYNNCGNLFAARGCSQQAIQHYAKALTLRPHDRNARQFTALAYATIGDLGAAAGIYRDWLKEEPDNPGLKHLLAACSGVDVPPRAKDDYIETTFDKFSESFESKLAHLQYRAPQIVAAAVAKLGISPEKRLEILDAGCGTGLCGPLLAPYAARLQGVDLSSGMLDKARPRGVYDELVKAELTAFLHSRRGAYDLIVSADTLVYFGVLDDVLAGAAQALRPQGSFIFTVERADDADAPDGHRINPHGRYSHTRDYVERTLANAGFAGVQIENDVLRQEGGLPVNGLVVTAAKGRVNAVESDHAR